MHSNTALTKKMIEYAKKNKVVVEGASTLCPRVGQR